MYVNPLHRLMDRETLFALMAAHPLGAWVCHGRDGLVMWPSCWTEDAGRSAP